MIGYVFCLRTNIILWYSRKQNSIALSFTEVESIAANESIWLIKIPFDLQKEILDPTVILCDNMLAIAMTKNLVFIQDQNI